MTKERILLKAAEDVRRELESDSSGHDWWHIVRVTRIARYIARQEQADAFVCELAALLHDIADEKLNPTAEAGMAKVRERLAEYEVDESDAAHVMEIIGTMSYKGGHNPPVRTKEAQVVQDADRIDALGAIGIARTFAYAGWKGSVIYDPMQPYRETMTHEEYRKGSSPAINHFYEKLLKLSGLMNTETGKRMAVARHKYMEAFLEQFYSEWDGLGMEPLDEGSSSDEA
ncbi:putative hydrolase [Paenibacillus konkukensis]|uniref:Hydrolase n=1 Tax=Paenibacillus konkukensis TaxID=2020716 RepID=A0ABY4RM21_9BACL|nr:HD domain-containing protein [Paenibacillus konkukensis]UQZ82499.1 putative hydrolase [Paenibacillus konkukensis]